MSTASNSTGPHNLGEGIRALRAKWGWIVAFGVVSLIAGVIALGSGVYFATATAVLIVGFMMLMAGAAEIVAAFNAKDWGQRILWLLLGALYVFAGFVCLQNPFEAATLLTLMLGIALIVGGLLRVFLAMQHEAGHAVGLGGGLGHHQRPARPDDRGPLAGLERLCARHLPRRRPAFHRQQLDLGRPGAAGGTRGLETTALAPVPVAPARHAGARPHRPGSRPDRGDGAQRRRGARRLIAAGANVNAQDENRDSAFLLAGAEGRLEILKMTLAAGADFAAPTATAARR